VWSRKPKAPTTKDTKVHEGTELLALAADVFADHVHKPAFGTFAELVVVRCFLADDEASTAVAGVEPFRGGGGDATGAVEADPRTHLDERPTLGKFRRLLVLDANQGDALVALEHANGTDRDFVAGLGLADGTPVSRSYDNKANHEYGRQHDCGKYEEGLFQRRAFHSANSSTHCGA